MQYGIADKPLDITLPYAVQVSVAAIARNFSRTVAYAIAWRETLCDQAVTDPANFIAGDGGYGICQLTAPFEGEWPPPNWNDPQTNVGYAIDHYLKPNLLWIVNTDTTLVGEPLVKVLAASYNAGLTAAWSAHLAGDVDASDTNDYGAGVLAIYRALVNTGEPD